MSNDLNQMGGITGFGWPGNSAWNRGLRNTDKSNIHDIFPLPSQNIPTRGTNMGVILRFKTFYLKIYDDTGEDAYLIKGFLYHRPNPLFEEIVLARDLRTFAALFTREDYLKTFLIYHKRKQRKNKLNKL